MSKCFLFFTHLGKHTHCYLFPVSDWSRLFTTLASHPNLPDRGVSSTRASLLGISPMWVPQFTFFFDHIAQAKLLFCRCFGKFHHPDPYFCPLTKLPEIFYHWQAPMMKPGERIYLKLSLSLRTRGSKQTLGNILGFLGMWINSCCVLNADVWWAVQRKWLASSMQKLQQNSKRHVTSTVKKLEDSGHFDKLPKNQRESLEAIGTIADLDLPDILLELTEILCRLHKEVVVLIDECRKPLSFRCVSEPR